MDLLFITNNIIIYKNNSLFVYMFMTIITITNMNMTHLKVYNILV